MIDIRYMNAYESPGAYRTSAVNCELHPEASVLCNYPHSGFRERVVLCLGTSDLTGVSE